MNYLDRLKYWLKKLNNRQYGEVITSEEAEQLKEDGLEVIIGVSDDLIELYGTYEEEVETNVSDSHYEWDYEDYKLEEIFDKERTAKPYFKCITTQNASVDITVNNILYANFTIRDGHEIYGNGVIFYWKDFINSQYFCSNKIRIKNIISKIGRPLPYWTNKIFKILELEENKEFKIEDIYNNNFVVKSSKVERIIDNKDIIIIETKNTIYEMEVL